MKTMPWLTGAALVFWGWQTGYWWLGALAAAILEGGRLARWQWNLTPADYRRIWDFGGALFAFLAVYFYSSLDLLSASHAFLLWLPMIFYPITLAQWFGPLDKIDYRVFWWWLRFRARAKLAVGSIGIAPLYFAICLFSTTALNMAQPEIGWFYTGFGLLSAAALWQFRPRHYALWLWVVALAIAAVIGFEGQKGLHDLQGWAENAFGNWLSHRGAGEVAANESRTAIGQIGKIQLSGRIVWRVEKQPGRPMADLLRQATYNVYRQEAWYNTLKTFSPVDASTNDSWILVRRDAPDWLSIGGYMPKGAGLLSLPDGTAKIENFISQEMEANPMGAVRAKGCPAFILFRADFGPGQTLDSPFGEDDFQVPATESNVLAQIVQELHLDPKKPQEALKKTRDFFAANFSYTTYLTTPHEKTPTQTPLGDFLVRKRAGHCEYFATATVLLLRQAGIPARYAVGYAVHESSGLNKFVVRERHGHAWCRVYRTDKQVWEDLDTTPDSWSAIEDHNASLGQPIADFFSRLWYEFSKWRYGAANFRIYVLIGLAIAVVLLGLQIIFQRRRKKNAAPAALGPGREWPGGDSEFYRIERYLAEAGWERLSTETPRQWRGRLLQLAKDAPAGGFAPASIETLDPILLLHYRLRFDPQGLPPEDRQTLRDQSLVWLEQARHYKTTSS